jgi:hypothetical protein
MANLKVTNTVTGAYSDISNFFKFTLNIKPPEYVGQTITDAAILEGLKNYKGFIKKRNGAIATVADLTTPETYGMNADDVGTYSSGGTDYGYIKIKAGETSPIFKLSGSDSIIFFDVHDGTAVDTTEIGPISYTPSDSFINDDP